MSLLRQTSGLLNDVVGCGDIERRVVELIRSHRGLKRSRRNARPTFRMHAILLGKSGTGKSTIPAAITDALFREKILAQGELMIVPAIEFADFMDHADERRAAVHHGAVLFDDVHRLLPPAGQEGLSELDRLLSFIDQNGTDPVVFVSAHPEGFTEYLEANPSFRSRFEYVFSLPELTADQIAAVCTRQLEKDQLELSPAAASRLLGVARSLVRSHDPGPVNGYAAVQLARDILRSHFARTRDGASDSTISAGDIPGDAFQERTPDEILTGLDDLVGMATVKEQLRTFAAQVGMERERVRRGLAAAASLPVVHLVLTGNPGTGKSTLARRLGELLAAMGILDRGHVVEVDAGRLISQYQGETRKIVTGLCDEALGGVLFIDEAYALGPAPSGGANPLGSEVVDALLKRMEDDRGRFVVVVAGYRAAMNRLLTSNDGLASRFSTTWHIDDYTPEELLRVFEGFAHRDGRVLTDGARNVLMRAVNARYALRDEHFANARLMRTLYETTCTRLASRVEAIEASRRTDALFMTIEEQDIPWDAPVDISLDEVMKEIDGLIGLGVVKEELRTLASTLRVQRAREKRGSVHKPFTEHFIFTGNPGTGKTTVARLVGRILKAIGALETGQLVEVTEKDLVGVVVGETRQKTAEAISSALGGVLFIDEAYTLVKAHKEHNFAREALEEILVRMENDRGKFCVIAAGYPGPMKEFLGFNPGMPSRFTSHIQFPDYTPDELVMIFRNMAGAQQMNLAPGTAERLRDAFARMLADPESGFANARSARTRFERALKAQARRLDPFVASGRVTDAQLVELLPEDIEP